MKKTWKEKFIEAIDPLTWGFEEGDDGSLITLALDEAASLLEQLPLFEDVPALGLSDLLRESTLSDELGSLEPIDTLYALGEQHNYGAGLREAEAAEAMAVAEEVCILLEKVLNLVNPGDLQ